MAAFGYAGTDEITEDRRLNRLVLQTLLIVIKARQNAATTGLIEILEWIMRLLAGCLLLLMPTFVCADTFHEVVGFQCDKSNDQIVITHEGAYNQKGESLVENMKDNQWDLWTLVEDNQTVHEQCRLSDGNYKIRISIYRAGSCDACPGLWVNVTNGATVVFDKGLDGSADDKNREAITKAIIKSHGGKYELSTTTWPTFLNSKLPNRY